MNVADYTTRTNYQKNYAKANREEINARKREWRKKNKLMNNDQSKIRRGEPKPTICITCNTEFTGSFTGECPDCEQKALQRFVSQPNPTTGEQEWTADSVMMMFLSHDGGQGRASEAYKAISDVHNAALAAATDEAIDPAHQEILVLRQQLAAEREKVKQGLECITTRSGLLDAATDEVQQLREQLAATVEALEFYRTKKTYDDWQEHLQFDRGKTAEAALAKIKL